MYEIKVKKNDSGIISISQPTYNSDDAEIFLHPDQADVLIKWLQEAKE